MASLESLKNPVQRLGVLGTAASQTASFRRNEVGNSDVWDATKQYYLNDIAFSDLDGGAYVFEGGATAGSAAPLTSILGGVDPAADWFSANAVWVPLASWGPRVVESPSASPQSATVAAGGAITFVNCDLTQANLGANIPLGYANYMAQIQFSLVLTPVGPATAIVAADWANLTLTPTGGTAAAARVVTVQPLTSAAGATTNNVALSVYVPLAADGTTTSIVLTGAMNAASTATGVISTVSVTYVPMVP
jgi:hypothetical protein